MPRAEVGVADYLIAVRRLGARDPALRQRIAALLGLAEPVEDVPEADDGPVVPAEAPPRRTWSPAASGVPGAATGPPVTPVAVPIDVRAVASKPARLSWPENLPAGPDATDGPGPRPPVPPLLAPRLERGIVQLLLSSTRPGRDLDVDAAVAALTRLELRASLPVRAERSVHAGCDLLVDVSGALEPYGADADRIMMLAEHVGGEATRILYFEQCPGRGVFSEDVPLGDYRPQHPRIVVVGTFGAGPARLSAGEAEWRAAVQALRAHGEVVGLCPFDRGRAAFAPLIRMVPWSEVTTTNAVIRVLGVGVDA